METAPTTHEARARNAKAQALAAILLEHGATVANVAELPAAGWSMVAELATHAELLGAGRKVHAPGSQATIDAVARILGDLIAHRDEQAVLAEAHAEPTVYTRTARDSVGYRQQMARIAPQPETTEADLFAPFGQAVNR